MEIAIAHVFQHQRPRSGCKKKTSVFDEPGGFLNIFISISKYMWAAHTHITDTKKSTSFFCVELKNKHGNKAKK